MSREILFKAKDKDDGRWYEGYYMCLHDTTHGAMPSDDPAEVKRLEEENTHHYIVFERMTDWELPNQHLRVEILPETLCQYTGLTDKNGKKIWENDIVLKSDVNPLGWNRTRNCKVLFTNSGYWSLLTEYGDGYWVGEFEREQLEVIGNIFDNPELLRGEDDGKTD